MLRKEKKGSQFRFNMVHLFIHFTYSFFNPSVRGLIVQQDEVKTFTSIYIYSRRFFFLPNCTRSVITETEEEEEEDEDDDEVLLSSLQCRQTF